MVGEVKSFSWGGARTKGELTSVSSSLIQLFFTIKNSPCELMGIQYRVLLTNHIELYARLTYFEPTKISYNLFARKCISYDWSNVPISLQYMPNLWSEISSIQYTDYTIDINN